MTPAELVEELLEALALPPEVEAEVRLVGGANGLALRVYREPYGESFLGAVRPPEELRPSTSRPNELPPELEAAIELVAEVRGATGDDALIASDVLELPILSVSSVEGALFAHWIGAW